MTGWNLYRFSGRTGRIAFALIQIACFITAYVFLFLVIVLSGAGDETGAGVSDWARSWVALATALFFLNIGWISLATAVRRCHDRGLSGWMLLFAMPPLLGQLWLVLSLVTGEGQPGRNRHGVRRPTFGAEAATLPQDRLLA